ncbi:hypothetical protein GN958_ATG16555 [Phytophthora infestans]|uniref:Uncharacterized protein n=1 Tax=Phytophthora infestans TaxID=4787 RepID=A0A8S9TZQ2_PHYIN|nr:hypothetical protein GN958_ATG16555 [Phytophthora infestans]
MFFPVISPSPDPLRIRSTVVDVVLLAPVAYRPVEGEVCLPASTCEKRAKLAWGGRPDLAGGRTTIMNLGESLVELEENEELA